MWLLSRSKNRL